MKKIAGFLLVLLAPGVLFATDFGLIIENTTSLLTEANSIFFQKDKATLWALFDLSENAAIFFEGYYRFNIQDPYHAYSLDRLELAVNFPVLGPNPFLFGFALGRLNASDFTGYVVYHPVDGARLVFRNPVLNAELVGGFTGFLFKGESTLVMSTEDANYSPEFIPLVPPRLVGVFRLNFPELFALQTLDVAVVGQLDLHHDSAVIPAGTVSPLPDSANGGKIDSIYAGLGLNGPLFPHFYWEVFFFFEYGRTLSYIGTTYEYSPIYAFLTGFELDWYFPEFINSRLSLDVIVSSGDGDYTNYLEGNSDTYSLQFIPVSRPTIGLAYAVQLTNLIVGRLEFTCTPFAGKEKSVWDKFQVTLAALTYFRAAQTDVSESRGLNSGSTQYYLGSEADLVITWKVLSDLGLELALGLFLPNNYTPESTFSPDGRFVEFLARFRLTFEI